MSLEIFSIFCAVTNHGRALQRSPERLPGSRSCSITLPRILWPCQQHGSSQGYWLGCPHLHCTRKPNDRSFRWDAACGFGLALQLDPRFDENYRLCRCARHTREISTAKNIDGSQLQHWRAFCAQVGDGVSTRTDGKYIRDQSTFGADEGLASVLDFGLAARHIHLPRSSRCHALRIRLWPAGSCQRSPECLLAFI